ncbi:hypothetical protein M5D96_000156 [Drosophila gunungcola]|uniref:Uncharacterized protein n=1 Tax=Drosophila gunungcola TaxID=103775 RepID=A0A9P9YW78_9MUSC|nr:hypothetical protein M5D96_000156 [Drosophila gunungcola]
MIPTLRVFSVRQNSVLAACTCCNALTFTLAAWPLKAHPTQCGSVRLSSAELISSHRIPSDPIPSQPDATHLSSPTCTRM